MEKHALLIANSKYNDERLNSLSAPSEDVIALKSVLDDPSIGGFDSAESVSNSSLEQVQRDLRQFLKNRSPDDLILIYFTGHGLLDADGKLWLALAGSDAESADVGSLEAEYLRKAMDKCASRRQVLILDCCHSGAIEKDISDGIVRSKDGVARPAVIKETFNPLGYGRYILASSSATQRSYEIGAKSIFTRALVEGLRNGSAAPGKDLVSLGDLANYAAKVLRDVGVAMTPFIAPDSSELDRLIFARNPNARESISNRLIEALNDEKDTTRRRGAIVELVQISGQGKPAQVNGQARSLLSERIAVEENIHIHKALSDALRQIAENSELLVIPAGNEPEQRESNEYIKIYKKYSDLIVTTPVVAAMLVALLLFLYGAYVTIMPQKYKLKLPIDYGDREVVNTASKSNALFPIQIIINLGNQDQTIVLNQAAAPEISSNQRKTKQFYDRIPIDEQFFDGTNR